MSRWKEFIWKRRVALQGETLHLVSQLQEQQWWERQQLDDFQEEKLSALLHHAYQHVPYYKRVLRDAKVIGENGRIDLESFSQIPLLERHQFTPSYDPLKSDDLDQRKWYENWSGGSTGEPIRLLQDEIYFYWNQALKILFDQWSGRQMVDRQILLWASERDLMVGHESWRTNLGRWLRNELWLNTRSMSREQIESYIAEINGFAPVQLFAYAESLYEIARYIEEHQLPIHSPKAIMTTASMLYQHMREQMERVFRCPVFNRYGSREIGAIACECEVHRGLHVSPLTHYVEILRPDGTHTSPGEQGELVITCLHNYAMPLIRYRIGDRAKWSSETCSCGRNWPLLEEITGRVNDLFLTPDGNLVDGRLFVILLGTIPMVKKFQVLQEETERLQISIIPTLSVASPRAYYREQVDLITSKCNQLMGEKCQIQLQFVEEIPTTPSGKYRFTISKVTPIKRD
ncbi:phenylacetate--CoA ligase family protein [Brevibacillus ginsengisoli]|uniref:phenylacetate--CoA ligase family protein n=1 Tax=Brevibacillus ginsengisoli TaxID=363854 RepID=UPI003CF0228D